MKTAIFLLIPAITFVYFPLFIEEFESSKTFVFLSFASFAVYWVDIKQILKDKVAQALLLLVISAAISTALSIDQHMSLFGNIKCRAGLLVFISYLVFYLAASQSIKNLRSALKAIDIMIACAAGISIYAIAQVLGYDFKEWQGVMLSAGYVRPMATLGHPNFMANYLAMILPYILWRMSDVQKIYQKILCALTAFLSVTAIWFSLSRGMIIAAIIGVLIYFFFNKKNKRKEMISFFIIIASAFTLTVATLPTFRNTALDRMQALFSFGPARSEYPKAAIRIWKKNPFFGLGTDTFEIGFQNQRTPFYWQIERGGSPHKAHNDFLNTLATQGVFGAVASLLIFAVIMMAILMSWSPLVVPAASSIAVFYIAGLSSFTVVATGMLFLLSVVFLKVDQT